MRHTSTIGKLNTSALVTPKQSLLAEPKALINTSWLTVIGGVLTKTVLHQQISIVETSPPAWHSTFRPRLTRWTFIGNLIAVFVGRALVIISSTFRLQSNNIGNMITGHGQRVVHHSRTTSLDSVRPATIGHRLTMTELETTSRVLHMGNGGVTLCLQSNRFLSRNRDLRGTLTEYSHFVVITRTLAYQATIRGTFYILSSALDSSTLHLCDVLRGTSSAIKVPL